MLCPGGAPVPRTGPGLAPGPPGAGRPAEAAGGHISSVCHPVRPPLPHPAAGCCGAGAHQAAHRSAGRERKDLSADSIEAESESFYGCFSLPLLRLESKTTRPLTISWILWGAGSWKLRKLWKLKIPTAPPTSSSSRTAWRSSRFVH